MTSWLLAAEPSKAGQIEPDKEDDSRTSLFNGENLEGWQVVYPAAAENRGADDWQTDPERKVLRSSAAGNQRAYLYLSFSESAAQRFPEATMHVLTAALRT